MRKIKIIVFLCIFIVSAFFIVGLPIFVSYSFWSEWGPDYSTGGYELGLMDFQDALNFTPNNLIDVGNWCLLAIYSSIPIVIFSWIYSCLNKPAK